MTDDGIKLIVKTKRNVWTDTVLCCFSKIKAKSNLCVHLQPVLKHYNKEKEKRNVPTLHCVQEVAILSIQRTVLKA